MKSIGYFQKKTDEICDIKGNLETEHLNRLKRQSSHELRTLLNKVLLTISISYPINFKNINATHYNEQYEKTFNVLITLSIVPTL